MNILSVIVAVLLIVLTLTFAVMLVSAIVFNMNAGRKYRKSLAHKVDRLRLSKMLGALGIDVDTYLHSENIVDIEQQMARCSACENTGTCDDSLATGTIESTDIGFCNNEESLRKIAEKQDRSHAG